MDIATNPEFRINLKTFLTFFGGQEGGISGKDLISMNRAILTRDLTLDYSDYSIDSEFHVDSKKV